MTGLSLPWKMNEDELKSFKEYCKKPISTVLIVGGAGLLMEHLFEFGGFDLLDFAGHEYYGLAMILAGFLLSMKWGQWETLDLHDPKNWLR